MKQDNATKKIISVFFSLSFHNPTRVQYRQTAKLVESHNSSAYLSLRPLEWSFLHHNPPSFKVVPAGSICAPVNKFASPNKSKI